ncbi:hypothetical protein NPL99_26620, partial [Klebsiella pneumoniae]|nr:hypothetical protein [Klebsiella pneumoniae]
YAFCHPDREHNHHLYPPQAVFLAWAGSPSRGGSRKENLNELQRNRDEMAQLRRELAQEKARSQELVSSVKQFRSSLNNLFDLADNP